VVLFSDFYPSYISEESLQYPKDDSSVSKICAYVRTAIFSDLYSECIQSQTGERKQLLDSLGYITTIIASARTLEHRQKYMKQRNMHYSLEKCKVKDQCLVRKVKIGKR